MKRSLIIILAIAVAALAAFFALSYVTEFRPEDNTEVNDYFGRAGCGSPVLPDTLKIMTWNIGYAGLGDNMDFCVDGGDRVRDTRERTEQNLDDIISVLKEADADIYLLQEVDEKSHRTYGINEIKAVADAFPEYGVYFAPNFKVLFVPSPLKEPIGRVCSGVLILSKFWPSAVRRLSYPSSFSFPVRMFNLKRCLLEADFQTGDGQAVHIGNTHNTAFDTGGMRTVEDEFVKNRIAAFSRAGERFIIAGDWNQCPPQYKPSAAELENKFFAPEIFDTTGINSFAGILCDTGRHSMRYNDKPYGPGSTKSLLDFCLMSKKGMEAIDVHTLDLKFHSSDHNPVSLVIINHSTTQEISPADDSAR